jgi:site-specific recombinase XerD
LPWVEMNRSAATVRSYRSRCGDLIKAFGDLELSQVSPFGIEKFKKEQLRRVTKRKRAQTPASVNRSLLTLGSIYTRAEQLKMITREKRPKIEMLREDSRRLRYLSIDEERRLLAAAAAWPYLHDIIIVGLATGLRREELFNLKKVVVDLSLDLVNVIDGKGGKSRSAPLDREGAAARVLSRLKRESRSDWIFTSHRTGRKFKHVNLSLKEALRVAGVEGVTLHMLRHTFCTRLAAAGVDIRTIKELAGHSDIATTMRYMRLVESNKHQAIRRLTNYHEFTTEKAPDLEARRA